MRSTKLKTKVSNHDIAVIWTADRVDSDPVDQDLTQWAENTLLHQGVEPCELAIKVVDTSESQMLNLQYRNKDAPTNVLSFPLDAGLPDQPMLLGDLAICAEVVRSEAAEQNKPVSAHFAHMVVHGVMHLLGFDHIVEAEAEEMEQIETNILFTMGFPDPYE